MLLPKLAKVPGALASARLTHGCRTHPAAVPVVTLNGVSRRGFIRQTDGRVRAVRRLYFDDLSGALCLAHSTALRHRVSFGLRFVGES